MGNGYGRCILTAKTRKNEELPPDLLLIKIGVVRRVPLGAIQSHNYTKPVLFFMPATPLPSATSNKEVTQAQVMGPSEEGGSFLVYTLRYDFVHFELSNSRQTHCNNKRGQSFQQTIKLKKDEIFYSVFCSPIDSLQRSLYNTST